MTMLMQDRGDTAPQQSAAAKALDAHVEDTLSFHRNHNCRGRYVVHGAIRKVAELNWKPLQFVSNVSISNANVIRPAGIENAQGVISAAYVKDPTDPHWDNDPGMMAYHQFLAKYLPETSRADSSAMTGYNIALTMAEVLKRCGDDLTRENLMKQAASLKDFEQGSLLPGIKINTSRTDYAPIEQLQLMRFQGEHWSLFGEVLSGEFHN